MSTPPAPITGSAMKAAIVSGPSRSIMSSRLRASRVAYSSSLSPGSAYLPWCGQSVCSTRAIGRSKSAWNTARPDRLAVATVVP